MTTNQLLTLIDKYANATATIVISTNTFGRDSVKVKRRVVERDKARAAVVAAIKSLESEVEMWKATTNAVVDFEKVELRKQVAALTKDAEMLDWLESSTESHGFCHTGCGDYRHYALQTAGYASVRVLLDAAIAAQKEQV